MKCYTFFSYVEKLKLGAGQPPPAGQPALWPFLDLTVSAMTEIHYTHIGGRHGKKNHLTLERILLCMQRAYKHAIITPSFEKRYAPSHNLYKLKVHNAHTINILLCILANIVCIITKYYVLSKLPSRVSCLLTVLFLHSTFLSIF